MARWTGKRQSLDLGLSARLVSIGAIFLLSFATFNILFKASSADGYFQEIIAALIGTILAAVVTTLLLRSQSQGEELKERNVAVFSRKLSAYETFLDITLSHLEDAAISDAEAHDLRRLVYKMALFSSEPTIEAVSRYVRCMYVRDEEGDLREVISAFRTELALENVDELSTLELSAVDTLLKHDSARANVETTRNFLLDFGKALEEKISKLDPDVIVGGKEQFRTTSAYGDGNSLEISLASGATFNVHMSYAVEEDTITYIDAWIDSDDLSPKRRKAINGVALSLGFEVDPDDPDDVYPAATVNPDVQADSSDSGEHGERVWTVGEIAHAIVEIEHRATS